MCLESRWRISHHSYDPHTVILMILILICPKVQPSCPVGPRALLVLPLVFRRDHQRGPVSEALGHPSLRSLKLRNHKILLFSEFPNDHDWRASATVAVELDCNLKWPPSNPLLDQSHS